jgi:hypothetical protein
MLREGVSVLMSIGLQYSNEESKVDDVLIRRQTTQLGLILFPQFYLNFKCSL